MNLCKNVRVFTEKGRYFNRIWAGWIVHRQIITCSSEISVNFVHLIFWISPFHNFFILAMLRRAKVDKSDNVNRLIQTENKTQKLWTLPNNGNMTRLIGWYMYCAYMIHSLDYSFLDCLHYCQVCYVQNA